MNNKHLILAVVVAAVVLGVAFFGFSAFENLGKVLGTATVTNSNVLNQARLATEITNVAAPLQNIGNGTTAALDFPNVISGSSTATSTQVTGLIAAVGDAVLVTNSLSETSTQFYGTVITASSSNATVGIIEQNGSGAAYDATSTTYGVIVLPFSSFKAVTGL